VDSTITAVKNDPKKKKLESEILRDLINDIRENGDGKKDTILNFPLARWLSKTVINRIQMCASLPNQSPDVLQLLKQVKEINNVAATTERPFDKFPVHPELKQQEDTFDVRQLRRIRKEYYGN
jgi:hypothetical protein